MPQNVLLVGILSTVAVAICVIGASSIWETVEKSQNKRDCFIKASRIELEGGAKGDVVWTVYYDALTNIDEEVPLYVSSFDREDDAEAFQQIVNGTNVPCWLSTRGGEVSGTLETPDVMVASFVGGVYIATALALGYLVVFYIPQFNWEEIMAKFSKADKELADIEASYEDARGGNGPDEFTSLLSNDHAKKV